MKNTEKLFSYDNSFSRGQMRIPAAEILQIAELSLIPGGEIRGHVQVCDEITLALSGCATVISGDRSFEMRAGQIHYIKKGEFHRIVASQSENFHYCCIGFLPDEAEKSIGSFLEAVRDKREFLLEDDGQIRRHIAQIIQEVSLRDGESLDMIHFSFCQMLIRLFRSLCGKTGERGGRVATAATGLPVYRALKFIDAEYMNLVQVKEIAAALSYSEYHLCHLFKEKMNMTVKEYLMQKKLLTALELLETSTMTVTEISDQLHFATPHAFSLAFKRYFGVSPSTHRKNAERDKKENEQ